MNHKIKLMTALRIIGIFFMFSLLFSLVTPVLADTLPKGVEPQRGKASYVYETSDFGSWRETITFWNVGTMGGGDYGKVTYIKEPIGEDNPPYYFNRKGSTLQGTFSGGPNGIMNFEGYPQLNVKMVNGIYVDKTVSGKTDESYHLPVENPFFIFAAWKEPIEEKPVQKDEREDSGARFSDLSGQIDVWCPPDDPDAWNFATLETVLYVDCHVKTSKKSTAILSFADMNTFTMKPQAHIVLSSSAAKDSQLDLLTGNLMVNIRKMLKDGSMEIEMSQAVAGIKGTTFVLEETGNKSTLKVIEGSVAYKSKTSGQTEMVNAGETVTADKNGLGQKTTFDVNAENADWKNLTDKTGKIGVNSKNYLYYLGIPAILAVIVAAFLVIKRKQK